MIDYGVVPFEYEKHIENQFHQLKAEILNTDPDIIRQHAAHFVDSLPFENKGEKPITVCCDGFLHIVEFQIILTNGPLDDITLTFHAPVIKIPQVLKSLFLIYMVKMAYICVKRNGHEEKTWIGAGIDFTNNFTEVQENIQNLLKNQMFQKFVHARFWIDIQKVLYAAGQNQIQYHSWVPSHHQQNTYHIPEQNFPNINLMPSVLPQLILSTIIKIYPAWFILHWTAQMVEQFPIHSEAEEHLLFEINIIGKLLSILITFDSDDIRQKNNGLMFQKSFITIPPNIPCKENSELLKYYFAFLWKRAFYDVIINRFNEYFEDSHTLINQFPYLSDVNNMLMNGYYVYDVGRTFILYLHNEVFGQDLQFSWSYDSFPEYPQQNDFLIHRNDDIYNKISYFPEDDFKYSDRY